MRFCTCFLACLLACLLACFICLATTDPTNTITITITIPGEWKARFCVISKDKFDSYKQADFDFDFLGSSISTSPRASRSGKETFDIKLIQEVKIVDETLVISLLNGASYSFKGETIAQWRTLIQVCNDDDDDNNNIIFF